MIATTSLPYPGLRPFEQSEADIFFGREEQTDELLRRLGAQRFLAVIGSSGCGKSSLVRAGMLPALETGFMASAGPRWRTATMRPGSHPFANLAHELLKDSALKPERGDTPTTEALLLATLRRGPLGLLEALRETPLPKDANLLVLVDQFEEIFRFRHDDKNFEADAFVSLLLESAEQREVPIYIVITMRSDYIGKCAAFTGLPEAINKSEYLTPRLSREQMRGAIEGPARVFGGEIEPALVNRLLNDTGGDPENLPVLQHLLMRMWTYKLPSGVACKADPARGAGADGAALEPGRVLTFDDYKNVGGFEGAISQHANEAFNKGLDEDGIGDKGRRIAEIIYRRLCEVGSNRPDSRRPSRLSEVTAVVLSIMAGAKEEDIIRTANVFRNPKYRFLVPPCPEDLEDRMLDLPHESLIRRWNLLKTWADREADSASTYRDLEHDAQRYKESKRLWVKPYLDVGLAWKQRENPTKEWAARYGGDLDVALAFLEKSRHARTWEGFRRVAPYAVLALLILVAGVLWRDRHVEYSQKLANKATKLLQSDPEASMWFGLLAVNEWPTSEANEVLQQSLQKNRFFRVLPEHHHGSVGAVAFSKDGKLIATGGEDGITQVWKSASGETLHSFEDRTGSASQRAITAIGLSKSGEEYIVAAVRADGRVYVHYLPSGESKTLAVSDQDSTAIFTSVTLSADSNYIATSSSQRTNVWDVQTGKLIGSIAQGHGRTCALSGNLTEPKSGEAPSPPSLWLAALEDSLTHPSIRIWEITTGKSILLEQMPPADTMMSKAAIAQKESGATSGREGTGTPSPASEAVAQRLLNRSEPLNLPADGSKTGLKSRVNSLVFSPKGTILAVGREDGTVELWQWRAKAEGGRSAILRAIQGHSQVIQRVAFSSDGSRVATASTDGNVKIWDLISGQELMNLPGDAKGVMAISLSTDVNLLITGSEDGTIKIWDISTDPVASPGELAQLAKLRLAGYPEDIKRGWCTKYLKKDCPVR